MKLEFASLAQHQASARPIVGACLAVFPIDVRGLESGHEEDRDLSRAGDWMTNIEHLKFILSNGSKAELEAAAISMAKRLDVLAAAGFLVDSVSHGDFFERNHFQIFGLPAKR